MFILSVNLVGVLFVYYLTSCWYLRNLSSRWGKKNKTDAMPPNSGGVSCSSERRGRKSAKLLYSRIHRRHL